jgi:hypothetical protein
MALELTAAWVERKRCADPGVSHQKREYLGLVMFDKVFVVVEKRLVYAG